MAVSQWTLAADDVVVVAWLWMLPLPPLVALNSFVDAAAGAFPFEKLP